MKCFGKYSDPVQNQKLRESSPEAELQVLMIEPGNTTQTRTAIFFSTPQEHATLRCNHIVCIEIIPNS